MDIDLANLKPMDDRIVLRRIHSDEPLIKLTDEEPVHIGEVVKVGPGRRIKSGWRRPVDVKVGDIVHYQSSDLDINGYILIMEADILGVMRA